MLRERLVRTTLLRSLAADLGRAVRGRDNHVIIAEERVVEGEAQRTPVRSRRPIGEVEIDA